MEESEARNPAWRPSRARGLELLALSLFALACLGPLFVRSLWTPDEPRVAEIGRTMLESGDWLVPRLAGEPFLEKPPLHWWIMAASYRVFGVSEASARLPSVVFAILTLLITFDMARRIGGSRAGAWSAYVLLTLINADNFFRVIVDPALAAFVALGYWAFQRAAFPAAGTREPSVPSAWVVLVYVAGGLAFLSKGIVGVGLLFGPIGLYVLATHRWSLLFCRAHLFGLVLLALMCAIWPWLLYQRGGRELLDGFLVDNLLYRFLGDETGVSRGGHKHPAHYYLLTAPLALIPWVLVLPALFRFVHRRQGAAAPGSGLAFMALAAPVGILLLSIPGTKRTLYILPLLPPLAVAVGVWLEVAASDRDGWSAFARRAIVGSTILVAASCTALGLFVLAIRAGFAAPESLARGPALSPWLATALVLASIGIVFALVREVRKHGVSSGAALAGWVGLGMTAQFVGVPLVDPLKDLRPIVEEMEASGAFESPVVGYRFDETTPSILGFYGGYALKDFRTGAELRDWVDAHPGTRVLLLERLQKRLRREARRDTVEVERFGWASRRTYVLVDLEPAVDGR